MVKTTISKYNWEGWQSVRDLSAKFGVSHRRIQQVIQKLEHEGKCLSATVVFAQNNVATGIPCYKLFLWYLAELNGE